jgi:hypothetical protein
MSGHAPSSAVIRHIRRTRMLWAAWLVLSLLGQALLPVQAHSRWHVDGRGLLVELCTLQGLQTVYVDPASDAPLPATPDADTSPAMVFSLLLGQAALTSLIFPNDAPPAPVTRSASPPLRHPLAPDIRRRPIRGPPGSC